VYPNSFRDIDYIRDSMVIKTGNRSLVSKIFEVAIHDDTMFSLIQIWWDLHGDEYGDWVLNEMESYLLEADQNVWSC